MSKQYLNDEKTRWSFAKSYPYGVLTGEEEGKLIISFKNEDDVLLRPGESAILWKGSFFNNWDVSKYPIINTHNKYSILFSLDKKSDVFKGVYIALDMILKPRETVSFTDGVFNVHGKNLNGLSITNDALEEMILQFNEDHTYDLVLPLTGEN